MHVGLSRPARPDAGDQRARQADRQVCGQRQMREIELLQDLVGGELPGQRGQEVALHARAASRSGGSSLLGLRQRGLLRQHVDLRGLARR